MQLESASLNIPPGFAELIADLGSGANGFGGTPVATGELTLEEYIQRCIEMSEGVNLRPEHVPHTVFWVIDENGEAIGFEFFLLPNRIHARPHTGNANHWTTI